MTACAARIAVAAGIACCGDAVASRISPVEGSRTESPGARRRTATSYKIAGMTEKVYAFGGSPPATATAAGVVIVPLAASFFMKPSSSWKMIAPGAPPP